MTMTRYIDLFFHADEGDNYDDVRAKAVEVVEQATEVTGTTPTLLFFEGSPVVRFKPKHWEEFKTKRSPDYGKYPECDKLALIDRESAGIHELMEWLSTNIEEGERLLSLSKTEELIAKVYGIDLAEVEAERRAMLDALNEPVKA